MRTIRVTRNMAERLKNCPNCDGEIEQVNSFRITCKECNYSYAVRSRLDKEILFTLALFLLMFLCGAVGYIIGMGF